jgi:hypothetical protein
VPIAATLMNPGSQVLVRIRAVAALRVDDCERRRQLGVRLVVIRDDQIDAELSGPAGRIASADAAVDRDDERDALRVKPLDRRRLQSVPVLQPFGDEVHDVAAEQLERAPQDYGRRDAVHVVVAVNGDPLLACDGRQDPIDRDPHIRERHGIVEVIQAGVQEAGGLLGIAEAPLTQQARDDGRDAEGGGQLRGRGFIAGQQVPFRGDGGHPQPPSSTKSTPTLPMFLNFS